MIEMWRHFYPQFKQTMQCSSAENAAPGPHRGPPADLAASSYLWQEVWLVLMAAVVARLLPLRRSFVALG